MDEFCAACYHGNINDVQRCVEQQDAIDLNRGLVCACFRGQLDTVELLIKHGANNWNQGLFAASACSTIDTGTSIVELMILHGANDLLAGLSMAALCHSSSLDVIASKLMCSRSHQNLDHETLIEFTISKRLVNSTRYSQQIRPYLEIIVLICMKGNTITRHGCSASYYKLDLEKMVQDFATSNVTIERHYLYFSNFLYKYELPRFILGRLDNHMYDALNAAFESCQDVLYTMVFVSDLCRIVMQYVIWN